MAFEITRKRRKGFPSESKVKRGQRLVHGEKELLEKLGRNDLCPCNSGRRFQELLHVDREVRWRSTRSLLLGMIRNKSTWQFTPRLVRMADEAGEFEK